MNRKLLRLLIALMLVLAFLYLAFCSGHTDKLFTHRIPKCVGLNTNDYIIVTHVRDQGYLFGDTSEAWHIRFHKAITTTTNDIAADTSDTKFAVDMATDMLSLSSNGIVHPVVYRSGTDALSAYLVTSVDTNDAYVLLFWR